LGTVLGLGRTTFRILTALVESSDDGMIRRLQLEDFHVSGERVIEVVLSPPTVLVPWACAGAWLGSVNSLHQ
jgi:hypothetical protein